MDFPDDFVCVDAADGQQAKGQSQNAELFHGGSSEEFSGGFTKVIPRNMPDEQARKINDLASPPQARFATKCRITDKRLSESLQKISFH
ncbi:hypothetical protein GCM10027514_42640 [Azotobacter armeniacus]